MFAVLLIPSPSVVWSISCCGTPLHNDVLATGVFSVGTGNEHSHISWRYYFTEHCKFVPFVNLVLKYAVFCVYVVFDI